MKSVNGVDRKLDTAEHRTEKPEDRLIENIQKEAQREQRIGRTYI